MFDFLVDHAVKNLWCTPNQDLQAIVRPKKITGLGGVFNNVSLMWRTLALPERGVRFHVYRIGQLNPMLMGLFPPGTDWVSMAGACNLQRMIVDIYSEKGIQLPRFGCWYYVTKDKDLVIAIKAQAKIAIDLDTEPVYLRVYTNAYFQSTEANDLGRTIKVLGKAVASNTEILAIQQEYINYSAMPGVTYAFINGEFSSTIDLINVKVDDIVEVIYDSSIYKVVNFPVIDLKMFDSTLDTVRKYLLHYPDLDQNDKIDYLDDIDVFVCAPPTSGRFHGTYYHRNDPSVMRMLTHRDYSVPVDTLAAYALSEPLELPVDQLTLRLHVRHAGYSRKLINEASRIKELYKLPDERIGRALLGLDATVPEWQAANLEQAYYTRLMGAPLIEIVPDKVQAAYGYNAISQLLADTPQPAKLINGSWAVELPYGLINDATAFEYDGNGKLTGWFYQAHGATYRADSPGTRLIEMLTGSFGTALDEVYGEMTQPLNLRNDYRMYVCSKVVGVPSNDWEDVTDSGLYAIIDGVLHWLVDPNLQYTLVRSNAKGLAYTEELPLTGGVLRFSLKHQQRRDNLLNTWLMQIPMGELDIFLNGKSLIEGLEYFVNFPEVVITNKTHLIEGAVQRVDIRFTGFCLPDLTRDPKRDAGFIWHGLLSHNNRFDIRDDKVMRIVVGGKTVDRSQLKFSEDHVAVTVPNVSNGMPYQLRDFVVPLRQLTVDDTYTMRAQAQITDERIADYMTEYRPDQVVTNPNVIQSRYAIFSPFCCKILFDLKNGILNDDRLYSDFSTADMFDICQPYESLLPMDPTQDQNEVDSNYVEIHPHFQSTVIEIDLFKYRFLSAVVKHYLHDKVSLSHFIKIAA